MFTTLMTDGAAETFFSAIIEVALSLPNPIPNKPSIPSFPRSCSEYFGIQQRVLHSPP